MYRYNIINDELLIMNQTIRIILATILVALNFTHPAHADAQEKFSFQGVSYNGDIKPEQFSFSDVMIKARSNTDRVNIKVIFQDVSTPYKSTDKDETVAITFEGDPESETVYAIRLDIGTFLQTIPRKFSLEGKENRYLISRPSVEGGNFNALYEQLTNDDKVKVKGMCHYFMDDMSIDKITSLKSPLEESVINKSKKRVDKLLSTSNISDQIKALATLCFQATNRVYVKDIQTFLNASGHNVGKIDGQWEPRSQSGWEAYLSSQGKPLDTTINATSVQDLVASIKNEQPKLRKINNRDSFFNSESDLLKHKLANIEQNFSGVITSIKGSRKWITVKTTFFHKGPDNVREMFRMGIDGNLEEGVFHALRFDKYSFRIPKKYSYKGQQPGEFYLAKYSINSGAFRNLYNYLDAKNQAKIEAACKYMNNSNVLDKILSTKSINNAHGTFLANPKARESLSNLVNLCVQNSAKVYVADVQSYLTALGYDVGKVDGKWGRKTELGLDKFHTDRGLDKSVALSSELLRKMKAAVTDKKIKFKEIVDEPEYFNAAGKLIRPLKRISIAQKIKNRKTINVFKAWNTSGKPQESYGLMWDGGKISKNPGKTITLFTVSWNYNNPGKWWSYYSGIEKYLTNKNWDHEAEYGKTVATKIIDPNFQDFIVDVMVKKLKEKKTDGIMLDWWHNNHQQSSGYSNHQVRLARTSIGKKLRAKIGPNKIILGNVNWGKDAATVPYINGVFLELYKNSNRLHGNQELQKIESLLNYYEEKLQAPKLIALEGWRKTKNVTDEDRNTPENRKMAKLLTAMSVVIPTNGYILYGDNNNDTPDGDHAHLFYDFYSFDIGKPTSGYNKVKSGVGYKEHERGFIAYNITGSSKKFKRKNGQEHTIEAKSGLFCKDVGAKTECLSNN